MKLMFYHSFAGRDGGIYQQAAALEFGVMVFENMFGALSFLKHRRDDDFVDRLSYFYTSSFLIMMAVLVSFKQVSRCFQYYKRIFVLVWRSADGVLGASSVHQLVGGVCGDVLLGTKYILGAVQQGHPAKVARQRKDGN
jgi:hypothetical protein